MRIKNAPTAWGKSGEYVSHDANYVTLRIKSKDDGGTSEYIVKMPRAMISEVELLKITTEKELNEFNENCQTIESKTETQSVQAKA